MQGCSLGWAGWSAGLSCWSRVGCVLAPAHLKLPWILPKSNSLLVRENEEGNGQMSGTGERAGTVVPGALSELFAILRVGCLLVHMRTCSDRDRSDRRGEICEVDATGVILRQNGF